MTVRNVKHKHSSQSHEYSHIITFLSCVKNKWNIIENKSNDTDDSECCLLDKENDPIKIFEFVTIALFAAVISCNTSEPIYFVKIVENNVARESLTDRFWSEILKGFYL